MALAAELEARGVFFCDSPLGGTPVQGLDEQARTSGNDARLKQAVREAYRRGLSFQQIADAIRVKNGHHHPTREAVRLRFGPYLAHRT